MALLGGALTTQAAWSLDFGKLISFYAEDESSQDKIDFLRISVDTVLPNLLSYGSSMLFPWLTNAKSSWFHKTWVGFVSCSKCTQKLSTISSFLLQWLSSRLWYVFLLQCAGNIAAIDSCTGADRAQPHAYLRLLCFCFLELPHHLPPTVSLP